MKNLENQLTMIFTAICIITTMHGEMIAPVVKVVLSRMGATAGHLKRDYTIALYQRH